MDYQKIWEASLPYMDARQNNIHIPVCYRYAEELVEAHPDCDRDVVLLGILLHDLGWSAVEAGNITAKVLSVTVSDERILHEKEGARIAREILEANGYPASMVDEICTIIDGHDTRLKALSLNDSLVKDADKLWRFDSVGVAITSGWFDWTPGRYLVKVQDKDFEKIFTDTAREIAHRELARSKALFKAEALIGEPR